MAENNELIAKLLARGDEATWNAFIEKDSKAAANTMIKCLDIIEKKSNNK